jgi:prepilin signal peptidase PulO-like enzyme (type II secretory pathway)
MENNRNTIAIRFGVIAALVGILYSLVLQLTDNVGNFGLGLLSYVITIVVLTIAINNYKKENNGFLSFKEGFSIGLIFIAIQSLLVSVYSYIYTKFIDTAFLENLKELQKVEMEKRGMSDDQIDQAMAISEWAFNPEISAVSGFVFNLFVGLIISLIVVAFMKKESDKF